MLRRELCITSCCRGWGASLTCTLWICEGWAGIFVSINRSGRPEFAAKSQQETDDYLIEGLEKWRENMGIGKMVLAGHSLGGYVATKYAVKFPSNIISLVLISPAAIWPTPPDFQEKMATIIDNLGFIQRNVIRKIIDYWVPGKTPLQLLRPFGRVASIALKKYVKMFGSLSDDERSDLKEYLYQILMKPGTGELALAYVLEKGAYGVDSLEKYLLEFKMPVSVYFGDNDWMAKGKPKDFGVNPYYLKNEWIREKEIKAAGHHICLDNPEELVDSILEHLASIPK
eukprot:TRINITY_DN8415_c0_g1_i11.p1 TRINITY_DN8415_c0_g1~~TRINITY_DN8415_c0_g1_i11.p1  ORF type:complete len:285 (-),score=56.86 TRINITY_DN8415_c0_g1_i11:108-962(-)